MRAAALGAALAICLLASGAPASAQGTPPSPAEVARGRYMFGATGGCGCHTPPKGQPNAGGRRYEGPYGTVYSSNITPDRQTGIGGWTDQQIITAIRLGRRPNGERLLPVHPYPVFNGMAEEDVRAIVAFLRTTPPVSKANQPKKLVPMFESVLLPAWLAAFAPRETPPPKPPAGGAPRGEYLVRAVGHCGECHTPRTLTLAPDSSRFLAGTSKGPEDQAIPNITPDAETGIGQWSTEEIADYLGSGIKPDGDVAGGLMAELIEGTLAGFKDLTKSDRLAIAQFLKTIPPIRNKIGKTVK